MNKIALQKALAWRLEKMAAGEGHLNWKDLSEAQKAKAGSSFASQLQAQLANTGGKAKTPWNLKNALNLIKRVIK